MKWQRVFWLTLSLGLGLRLLSAYFVYGPQALDDYKHGVLPAYQWAAGLADSLPGYRSYLIVWFLGVVTKFSMAVGIDSPLGQVRVMYAALAIWSLVAWAPIPTVAKQRPQLAIALMYLLAFFPLMPFVSTRAFGEAMALPLVLSGLLSCEIGRERKSLRWLVQGFVLLGFATYFRFQVGLIYMGLMLVYMVTKYMQGAGAAIIAGIPLLGGQVAIDILSGRKSFGTLQNYLLANEGGAVQYGVSPWYNTWLLVAGMMLVPFSLGFGKEWLRAFQRQWRILVPVLIFILAHSLTPHKEERFMYPILGVCLLVLAELLSTQWNSWFNRVFFKQTLLVLSILGIGVACFNNSQVGEVGPAAEISHDYAKVVYLDNGSLLAQSRIKDFFVRSPSEAVAISDEFSAKLVDDWLAKNSEWQAVAMLSSNQELSADLIEMAGTTTGLAKCGQFHTASSAVDMALFSLNPKHNQRRRPTWYLVCERKVS